MADYFIVSKANHATHFQKLELLQHANILYINIKVHDSNQWRCWYIHFSSHLFLWTPDYTTHYSAVIIIRFGNHVVINSRVVRYGIVFIIITKLCFYWFCCLSILFTFGPFSFVMSAFKNNFWSTSNKNYFLLLKIIEDYI